MAKILVVEDEKEVCALICDCLNFEQHTVEAVYDGQSAVDLLRISQYDLIVLDWLLPGMNGLDVCKQLREWGGTAAILMLTGKHSIPDKEAGLDAGADDYLTKPFHAKELVARVRALLRRSGRPISQNVLHERDLVIDLSAHRVKRSGEEIRLIPKEFALLEFLLRHKGTVFDADALIARVWPADDETSSEMIRTHIKNLRKKLDVEGQPSIIRTVHKVGYVID